jgi:hypothetical protein
MSAVQSSTASYVHLFVFFLLVPGFNPAWFGHYGFLEDEGLVRQAGEKHLRCAPFCWCSEGRLRSWYEDGARDCRHVLPGVGSMGRTGGPALGPADRSLLSSAYCGTDAGAATAATG